MPRIVHAELVISLAGRSLEHIRGHNLRSRFNFRIRRRFTRLVRYAAK
jgi:hypothetical protein